MLPLKLITGESKLLTCDVLACKDAHSSFVSIQVLVCI